MPFSIAAWVVVQCKGKKFFVKQQNTVNVLDVWDAALGFYRSKPLGGWILVAAWHLH
jgi:hypothetical protein